MVWLRDGQLLDLQEGCITLDYEENGICTLTLEHVSLHHSGLYSCRATNVHGEALCSSTITVVEYDGPVDS